ncbi:agmatine deiminase family protein [Prochlorothrix hollandica]|uniref:Agmatine deiminase n=1 Tax=Prochlorothrix hollandica PCC 9006 = CALU 1027 TaxID=317619 RepID=A0A0M2Q414_PROHO|nr:agmatine deiminase family protein [Prochlorothrix hollandica]KKJ01307.1 agmatine deiminase [Prochlorothrix hollandica PCC 9006 = CALU 1027]
MVSRRKVMQATALFTGGLLLSCSPGQTLSPSPKSPQRRTGLMPDEGSPHQRTWMAFGASAAIWGADLLPEVERNLVTIAHTIAHYEPVSMLVRPGEYDRARNLLGSAIDLVTCPLDDLWIRDTGPTFVVGEGGQKAAIDFNFNGWGQKQSFKQDGKVAALVTQRAGADAITTAWVLEGGCLEVDGQGTALVTESCVLNDNRNPGLRAADCEAELKTLLGVEKIIWLPGIRGKDITDGHTDFYGRFAAPGVVLAGYDPDPESYDHAVTLRHLEILRSATDAHDRPLTVKVLEAPTILRDTYLTEDFAPGYVGFYLCNGAVIMQEFGDGEADAMAQDSLRETFPDRDIIALNIDGIAAGGGTIHCTTQQEPLI